MVPMGSGLVSGTLKLDAHRKSPWRLSRTRKANQRKRLKDVDSVIAAVAETQTSTKSLTRALELPTESEMVPRGESVPVIIKRS